MVWDLVKRLLQSIYSFLQPRACGAISICRVRTRINYTLSSVFILVQTSEQPDSLGLSHICFIKFQESSTSSGPDTGKPSPSVVRELDQGIPEVDSLVAGWPGGKYIRLQLREKAWLILPLSNLHVK